MLVSTDAIEGPHATISVQSWTPGPAQPRLAPGVLDLWLVELTSVSDGVRAWLSGEERARAARIAGAREGTLWARGRGVLRDLLARYLQTDPLAPRIVLDGLGKPALEPPADGAGAPHHPSALSFNLSHSAGRAIYAVTRSAAVGVDLEVARRPIETVALAARAFGRAEAERLRRLDPEVRQDEFLRRWVRREATLKCSGAGIGGSAGTTARSARWVAELDMQGRGHAAVALSAPAAEVRCWQWPTEPRADTAPTSGREDRGR